MGLASPAPGGRKSIAPSLGSGFQNRNIGKPRRCLGILRTVNPLSPWPEQSPISPLTWVYRGSDLAVTVPTHLRSFSSPLPHALCHGPRATGRGPWLLTCVPSERL